MRLLALVLLATACHPPGYDRHDVDAPPAPTDAATPPTGDAIAAATCMHAFRLDGHGAAQTVWLSGDFVQWAANPSAGALVLTRDAGGGWNGSYAFTAGPHQYKFIIDANTWIDDPTNPMTVDDGMGNINSLYTCTP